jgi:hypothetical protein
LNKQNSREFLNLMKSQEFYIGIKYLYNEAFEWTRSKTC